MLQKTLPVLGIVIFALLSGMVSDMSAVAANVKSNLIVLVGTFLCCLISHSPRIFAQLASDIRRSFNSQETDHKQHHRPDPGPGQVEMGQKGDIELDRQAKKIDNSFLRMGIEMVVDGY